MITNRFMRTTDLNDVVSTHLASFQGFFLSFLGPAFLKELYAGTLADASGIAIVAQTGEKIQGFVAGTDNPQGFYKRLLRQRGLHFARASMVPMLRNPTIMPRLLRAFSRSAGEDVHDNCATLMSIAVAPEAQGQGIGQLLVRAFLEEAGKRGVECVNLTTDQENNDAVNTFYQKVGFYLSSQFITPEGRKMNEYMLELPLP